MTKKILFIFLFSNVVLFAQTKDEPTEQPRNVIRVYTPSEVTAKKESDYYNWCFKTDLFSFITGEFPLIGEYRLTKRMSVEGAVGVTYGFLENGSLFSITSDNALTAENAALGSSFRAGIKFYPSDDYDAIEGWAFGLQVFTKTTNREYAEESDFSGELDVLNKTGLSITISKQIFWESNVCFEYFIGLGMAKNKREFYEGVYDGNNNYLTIRTITEDTRPNLQLGLRIGFGK